MNRFAILIEMTEVAGGKLPTILQIKPYMSIIKTRGIIFTIVLGDCEGSIAAQAHFALRGEFRRLRPFQVGITEYGRAIHLNLNYVREYNNSRG